MKKASLSTFLIIGATLVAAPTVLYLARRRQKQPSHYVSTIELDDEYRLLYSNEDGINANIKVCSNGTSPIDIKMTDVNENIVWEGSKAIGSNSYRTFWCGEDVAKVYARTSANCQCNAYM